MSIPWASDSNRKVSRGWASVSSAWKCVHEAFNSHEAAQSCFDKHVPAINKEIVPVDVDKLLEEKSADGYVLHDDHLVHVCTFSAKACKAVHQVAMSETGIKLEFTELALQGTQEIGNTDKNQKDEVAVCTANFGATEINWMQPAVRAKSASTKAIDDAIKSTRGGSIQNSAHWKYSVQTPIAPLWKQYFRSVFSDESLPIGDQWYSDYRPKKKKRSNDRFSTNTPIEKQHGGSENTMTRDGSCGYMRYSATSKI